MPESKSRKTADEKKKIDVVEFVPAEHRAVLEDTAQHLEQRMR